MLPEVWFSSPLDGGGSGSGSFAVDTDDSANEEQMNKFLGLVPRKAPDAEDPKEDRGESTKRKAEVLEMRREGFEGGASALRKRLRRRRGGHSFSADMTGWPSWVYSQVSKPNITVFTELRNLYCVYYME